MRRKRVPNLAPTMKLQMTSMIDIVFLLLVFFLLTTQFVEEEGVDITLPTASAEEVLSKEPVVVIITKTGEHYVGGRLLSIEGLRSFFKERCDGDTTVTIRGDKDLPLQACVTVMEAARNGGAGRIVIATLSRNL